MALNAYRGTLLSVALVLCAAGLSGKTQHGQQTDPSQDEIRVVAHVEVPGGLAVTRFLTTQHYRRNYLYAEHAAGQPVTLIDVTTVQKPAVLANVSSPEGSDFKLVAVTGNAALASSEQDASPAATPQTFRIMSFADPLHPAVRQEFAGVTAMAKDEKRGLIYLANPQGVWILEQRYAPDPQAEKEWEHMMLDAR